MDLLFKWHAAPQCRSWGNVAAVYRIGDWLSLKPKAKAADSISPRATQLKTPEESNFSALHLEMFSRDNVQLYLGGS